MSIANPESVGAPADIHAELQVKDAQLLAFKEKYETLSRRFRENLSTLAMLFAAQARRSTEPDFCRKCLSCLAGASDIDEIRREPVSMSDYLPMLSKALLSGFDQRLRLATSIDPGILVEFHRAQCIGLVYVEATANAFKHAFTALSSGAVYATLRGDARRLELTVIDSGLGFSPEAARMAGGGLEFMRAMARQIEGELTIRTSPAGTTVYLSCPASSQDFGY